MSKGISAIITIILLLLITIVIAGFAMLFFSNIFTTSTTETQTQLTQQFNAGKNIRIENVAGNNITLRNIGTKDIPINEINFYVENSIVTFTGPGIVSTGQLGNYILNNSQLAMLPDPANLKVTTPGLSAEKQVGFYTNNIVGYWKFDDGSGNITKDSSGKGNDGRCFDMGTSCNWTTGKYGGGISFDGTDDFVNVSDSQVFNLSQFTVEAWVYPRNIEGTMDIIIGKGYFDLVPSGFFLTIDTFFINFFKDSNSVVFSFPQLNRWYHVAAVYNGTHIKLYVDGVLRSTTTASGTLNNPSPLKIGSGDGGVVPPYFFNGTIDEVRIMNIARP